MKQMKRLSIVLLLTILATGSAFAQEKQKKQKAKDHTCTETCKEGNHMYACGEKGHKCTDECKKDMKKHGEKGHECTAECKKDMKKAM